MDRKILVNAEKAETKNDSSIDYGWAILELMGKVRNKDLLKRVYKLLVYLHLHKDDEESITEPLATELMCDYQKELQEHLVHSCQKGLRTKWILDQGGVLNHSGQPQLFWIYPFF